MIELTALATAIVVFGTLAIPRTTFLIIWFFKTAAVSAVLGGSALVLAVLGVLIVPRVVLTYLLLETVVGAPASGTTLYWMYLGVAALTEILTTASATNRKNG